MWQTWGCIDGWCIVLSLSLYIFIYNIYIYSVSFVFKYHVNPQAAPQSYSCLLTALLMSEATNFKERDFRCLRWPGWWRCGRCRWIWKRLQLPFRGRRGQAGKIWKVFWWFFQTFLKWEFGAASFLQFTWSFIILHRPARQIQGHARFPENSVRERSDKRKRQRKEKAERKEAEKIRRTEELKRCSAALLVQSPLFKKSILMNHHVCTWGTKTWSLRAQ